MLSAQKILYEKRQNREHLLTPKMQVFVWFLFSLIRELLPSVNYIIMSLPGQ